LHILFHIFFSNKKTYTHSSSLEQFFSLFSITFKQGINNMALFITEECTYCGACEPECPVSAITAGDDIYVIDAAGCTECVGYADAPACVAVCPAECIVQG
jgi:ferredoxin